MKPQGVTGELVLMYGRTLAWVMRDSCGIQLIPYPDGLANPWSPASFYHCVDIGAIKLVGSMIFQDLDGKLVAPSGLAA